MFQPTHPHGVRQPLPHHMHVLPRFQPTHPHGVRRGHGAYIPGMVLVSTHAPARGATWIIQNKERREEVSTHAPARGATEVGQKTYGVRIRFNPRTRTGCDIAVTVRGAEGEVSTHAPARGATYAPFIIGNSDVSFNPRTRTGCDPHRSQDSPDVRVSTHAPARGATVDRPFTNQDGKRVSTHAPARGATVIGAYGTVEATFQPTHPHGVRLTNYDSGFSGNQVSTHAPARGATQFWSSKSITASCFNPRTRTGCDICCRVLPLHKGSFNPRTRTGCDRRGRPKERIRSQFQPTHPHGVRQGNLEPGEPRTRGFNPRTRTGCDFRLSKEF